MICIGVRACVRVRVRACVRVREHARGCVQGSLGVELTTMQDNLA